MELAKLTSIDLTNNYSNNDLQIIAKYLKIKNYTQTRENLIPQIVAILVKKNTGNLDFDKCSNDIDFVSQTNWSEYYEPDIKIDFNGNINCYSLYNLQKWINDPNNTFAEWIPQTGKIIDKTGHGGKPNLDNKVIKLYTGEYILYESDIKPGEYLAEIQSKNTLIGNIKGSFGISELHGQSPGYTIWKLKLIKAGKPLSGPKLFFNLLRSDQFTVDYLETPTGNESDSKLSELIVNLDCHNFDLNYIPDLPNCETLDCSNNKLIKLPKLPNIDSLDCSNNLLTGIPEYKTMTELNCKNNKIKKLDLVNVIYLDARNCELEKIIGSKIELCYLDYNNLQELNLPNAEKVYVSNNKLETINIPKCINLYCNDNNLKILPNMPKLKKLVCKNNPLPFFELELWKNEWKKNDERKDLKLKWKKLEKEISNIEDVIRKNPQNKNKLLKSIKDKIDNFVLSDGTLYMAVSNMVDIYPYDLWKDEKDGSNLNKELMKYLEEKVDELIKNGFIADSDSE